MFLWQPMYTDLEAWEHHEDEHASTNCLIGAGIYCVTLVVSFRVPAGNEGREVGGRGALRIMDARMIHFRRHILSVK